MNMISIKEEKEKFDKQIKGKADAVLTSEIEKLLDKWPQ